MKSPVIFLLFLAFCSGAPGCHGQPVFGTNLLHLDKEIPLTGVKGRIDHMDVNLQDKVMYVAALGNNTVEVVDLLKGTVIHSIKGLDEPQGVCYLPQRGEIFVANGGNGDCYFYNAHNFEKVATLSLGSDADDVRYDASDRKIYVGYGSGGIAVIDANTHRQTGDVKLPGHPESFQLDKKLQLLFVNVPDASIVAVIDLLQLKVVTTWKRSTPSANFPMAIDTLQHRLFIGYRHPATLLVMDGKTGQVISSHSMTGDADDVYYDEHTATVFVSGGDGYISLFKQQGKLGFQPTASISTRQGARTSLLIPELNLFVLASRATAGKGAALWVYTISR